MARKKISPKEFAEIATGVRLSSHERLCAERMKHIQESIKDLSREVKSLRNDGTELILIRMYPMMDFLKNAFKASFRFPS